MFRLGVLLPKDECITEEDDFAIDIFDEDGERLSITMSFIIPFEVGDDGEVDAKEGTCNGLNRSVQAERDVVRVLAEKNSVGLTLTSGSYARGGALVCQHSGG